MRKGARLGQHFLNAQWVARDLVASLDVTPNETLLEIGPGKGALTKHLLTTGNHVVAVEKDERLVEELRTTFSKEIASGQLTLVEQDIRDFEPSSSPLAAGNYSLAANIPYYITGEIIRRFLEASSQPRALALLIQKEVAERIVARDGKESILSISVKAYGEPRIVAKVGKSCFNPPPSVDSAILLVKNVSRNFFADLSEETFFRVVRAGFSSKRKKLTNNLSKIFENPSEALAACAIPDNIRAEDVPLEKWREMAREPVSIKMA